MLDKYIEPARRANRHPAKLTVLSELLKEIFNVKLERFKGEIEEINSIVSQLLNLG